MRASPEVQRGRPGLCVPGRAGPVSSGGALGPRSRWGAAYLRSVLIVPMLSTPSHHRLPPRGAAADRVLFVEVQAGVGGCCRRFRIGRAVGLGSCPEWLLQRADEGAVAARQSSACCRTLVSTRTRMSAWDHRRSVFNSTSISLARRSCSRTPSRRALPESSRIGEMCRRCGSWSHETKPRCKACVGNFERVGSERIG